MASQIHPCGTKWIVPAAPTVPVILVGHRGACAEACGMAIETVAVIAAALAATRMALRRLMRMADNLRLALLVIRDGAIRVQTLRFANRSAYPYWTA
jgi:hypothetical protein